MAPATLFGFMASHDIHTALSRASALAVKASAEHTSLRMQGLQQRPPIVVAAHGIAGQKDMGLEPFAETFASKGLAVLLFDYRNFGGSEGEPRNWVSPKRHLQDWDAALDYVRVREIPVLLHPSSVLSPCRLCRLLPLTQDLAPALDSARVSARLQCVPAVPPSVLPSQLDLCTCPPLCFQSRMISASV